MHTLTVTLADLEGVTHGTTAAHTSVKVSARYSREVILTDGTIIPVVIKDAAVEGDGIASFEVYESDSADVDTDYQGFAIVVTATVKHGHADGGTYRRTVQVTTASADPVPLGSLPSTQGLPAKWTSIDALMSELTTTVATEVNDPTSAAHQAVQDASAGVAVAAVEGELADPNSPSRQAIETVASGYNADTLAAAEAAQTSAEAAAADAQTALAAQFMTQDEGVATLISDDVAGPLTNAALYQSAPAQEVAELGPETIADTGWTLGAGWSGDFATGFTKAAGGTGALTWTPPYATGTKNYIVSFTVDTPSNANLNYLFTLTLGDSFPMVMYEGSFLSHTYTRGIRSTVDGGLVFTPEATFAGTVTAVSVREVSGTVAPLRAYRDSTDATVYEVRNSTRDLNNIFMGRDVGRSNVSGHQSVVIGQGSYGYSTSGFWNAAIGYETLRDNVNGTRNCTLGVFTLERNITGHRNVAIGPYSMRGNTHGKANVSIGVDTMWLNETGDYNIALGQAALGESVTGDGNTAIGRGALGHADGMSNHIAIGDYASWELNSEATGNTIAIGQRALRNATNGGNLAIGNYAGNALTTGFGHTILGHEAGMMLTDNMNCTLIGQYAGHNITGQYNTAVGMNALGGTAAGNVARNTGVGYGTLTSLQAGGDYNVAIGASSGATVTTGQFNVLIGYNAQSIGPTDSNYLNIGNAIHGYMSGTKRIGIGGVTYPTAGMHLRAGVSGANGAPLKFTTGGTLLTTPEPGAVEFDGTDLYFTTTTGVRKKVTAA